VARRKKPHALLSLSVGMPRLSFSVQKYRVVEGREIVGQFSNVALTDEAVRKHPKAIVFDVSMCPSRIVQRGARLIQ